MEVTSIVFHTFPYSEIHSQCVSKQGFTAAARQRAAETARRNHERLSKETAGQEKSILQAGTETVTQGLQDAKEKIIHTYEASADIINHTAQDAKHKLQAGAEVVGHGLQDAKEKLVETYEAGLDKANHTGEALKSKLSDAYQGTKEAVVSKWEGAKEAAFEQRDKYLSSQEGKKVNVEYDDNLQGDIKEQATKKFEEARQAGMEASERFVEKLQEGWEAAKGKIQGTTENAVKKEKEGWEEAKQKLDEAQQHQAKVKEDLKKSQSTTEQIESEPENRRRKVGEGPLKQGSDDVKDKENEKVQDTKQDACQNQGPEEEEHTQRKRLEDIDEKIEEGKAEESAETKKSEADEEKRHKDERKDAERKEKEGWENAKDKLSKVQTETEKKIEDLKKADQMNKNQPNSENLTKKNSNDPAAPEGTEETEEDIFEHEALSPTYNVTGGFLNNGEMIACLVHDDILQVDNKGETLLIETIQAPMGLINKEYDVADLCFRKRRWANDVHILDKTGKEELLKCQRSDVGFTISGPSDAVAWLTDGQLNWDKKIETIIGSVDPIRMFAIGCCLNRLMSVRIRQKSHL